MTPLEQLIQTTKQLQREMDGKPSQERERYHVRIGVLFQEWVEEQG